MIGGTETRLYRNAGGTLVDDGAVAHPRSERRVWHRARRPRPRRGSRAHRARRDAIERSGTLDVYRNDAGTFTLATQLPSPIVGGLPRRCCRSSSAAGRTSIAIADFDGDGAADVATTDLDGGGARVFFGNGALGFGPGTHLPGALLQGGLLTGDVTGDGAPDLAVVTAGGTRALAVFAANAKPAARDCTGDGVPTSARPTRATATRTASRTRASCRRSTANGDGIPDCVERDAACGNCVDDDGDGALDLADPSCPSAPFGSLKAIAAASKGKKPGKLVANATVETALPDPTPPRRRARRDHRRATTSTAGGRRSRSAARALQARGAGRARSRASCIAVNAKKHRTKLRVHADRRRAAPSDGAAFGVSLDAAARTALHTSATLHAKGKRFVGP
jgi:hypothetical protein